MQLAVLDQMRIEFWGEGNAFPSAKRIQPGVMQYYKGTNAPANIYYINAQGMKPNWNYVIPNAVCYTYAVKKRSSPDPTLGGADITDDSAVHQGYLDAAARKEKWGDKYETYEKKIEEAVKDVFGKTITYDGEIITAAFHAISCGQTFSAEEVWGKDVPYLKSVTSAGDKLSPDYSSTLTLTADEFKKAFAGSGAEFGGDAKKWIGEIKKTDSGYISCAVIGEKEFTGAQVREKLGLRSACFEIKCTDDEFKITVHGYGHGVGMSQYGADYMARQGSDWQEIIKHYYTGVEIK